MKQVQLESTLIQLSIFLLILGLKVHLMAQPLGYKTPDVASFGWVSLPEFPYG